MKHSIVQQAFNAVDFYEPDVLKNLLQKNSQLVGVTQYCRQPLVQHSYDETLLQHALEHESWTCALVLMEHGADPLQETENNPSAFDSMTDEMIRGLNPRMTKNVEFNQDEKTEVFVRMHLITNVDPINQISDIQRRFMENNEPYNRQAHERYQGLLAISRMLQEHPLVQQYKITAAVGAQIETKSNATRKKI